MPGPTALPDTGHTGLSDHSISDLFIFSFLLLLPSWHLKEYDSVGLSRKRRDRQKGRELAAEVGKQKQKWQENLKPVNT